MCLCNFTWGEKLILDLEEAINFALGNNPSLMIQSRQIDVASSLKGIRTSAYLPQLGVEFSAIHINDHPYLTYRENYELNFSLRQEIFNLKYLREIKASAYLKDYQLHTYEDLRQAIIYSTIVSFYRVLLEEENLKLRGKALNLASEQKRIAQVRYEEGYVSYYDLLRAETNYHSACAELRRAEAQYQKAVNEFKVLLGLDPEKEIELRGEFNFKGRGIPLKKLIYKIYAGHPKLKAYMDLINQKREELKASYSEYLPTISLEFYDTSARNVPFSLLRDEWDDYWIGYIKVSLPIFEGGRRFHQIKQLKQELRQLELKRLDLINEIKGRIFNFCHDYQASQEVLKAQRENLKKAKELYRLVKERYINGEAPEIELLDAYINLIQTELAYKEAMFGLITSYYGLLYSAGQLNPEVLHEED